MPRLTEFTTYADAQRHFSREALWELFEGNRDRFNIAHECLDRHAAGHDAGRSAVRVAHADGRDEAYTFDELAQGSSRFANWLQSRGLEKGDRVAIMLEPCLAFYLALFGVMKAGCVAVPLFTLFGPDGLRLRIEDCRPRLLITSPEHAPLAEDVAGEVAGGGAKDSAALAVVVVDDRFLAALAAQPAQFTPETSADDMALFQYTSGTTRELPEAVRHRHRALVVVMIAALYGTGVRPGDQFMCPSSPAWGHGLWHGTLAPLGLGVSIATYAGQFDPHRMMQALADYGITNLSAAATHYRMMKNSGTGAHPGFAIEKLSFTGEPIDTATAEWARATFGQPVCSIYGTTEVGVIIADYPGAPDHAVKPGALGRPVPGVELAIHDPQGRPCPPGVAGDIVVRRGESWFATKDRGHVDAHGYYFHRGRADDVIISAGWTMSAVEIEHTLLKHEDVREAAVIGVADAIRGQVVKAFIVSRRCGGDEFMRELQTFVQQRLSRHEYPRLVAFVEDLPKTEAGKLNRKALRDAEQASQQENKT